MFNSTIHYPYLELLFPAHYESLIHNIFENISHIPLCWLAAEELEDYFAASSRLNEDLYFKKRANTIDIRLKHTNRTIARIHFQDSRK